MYNITDKAVEFVKILVDSNRCEACDNLDGDRVRHQCGHCFCGDCVAKLGHCLLCTTPPGADEKTEHIDTPAAQRANNAAKLLNTFQEAFNVDVYMRSRISDQLRAEKEVFPDCIQAPVKYHNKRKSSIVQSNKENRWPSFFPGELVSTGKTFEMENSLNYVQNWLDSNKNDTSKKSPRKVFADLNVNSPNACIRQFPKRAGLMLDKNTDGLENTPKKRKTSFKTSLALVKNQSLLDKYIKDDKQNKIQNIKNESRAPKANATKLLEKTDKDESGIVIDDDLVVIDDTISQVVDKDKLAWQAVLEANEQSPYVSQSLNLEHSDVIHNTLEIEKATACYKVPFFKRSHLTETCNLCKKCRFDTTHKKNQIAGQPDNVSITIESNTLKATIKIISVKDRQSFEKHSVSAQTDSENPVCYEEGTAPQKQIDGVLPKLINEPHYYIEKDIPSQDLFTAEIKHTSDQRSESSMKQKNQSEQTQLVIADSDSDDAANESSIIQVSAEVHHYSEIEPQVLREIVPSEAQQRIKRSNRGHTPNSTDSSEKENFDPNRSKRMKLDKKTLKKRKLFNKVKKCC